MTNTDLEAGARDTIPKVSLRSHDFRVPSVAEQPSIFTTQEVCHSFLLSVSTAFIVMLPSPSILAIETIIALLGLSLVLEIGMYSFHFDAQKAPSLHMPEIDLGSPCLSGTEPMVPAKLFLLISQG